MECDEVQRALHAYVDNELGPEDTTSVRTHLADCGASDRRVAQLESLSRLLGALPSYPAPGQLHARIGGLYTQHRTLPQSFELVAAVLIGAVLATSVWWLSGLMHGHAD